MAFYSFCSDRLSLTGKDIIRGHSAGLRLILRPYHFKQFNHYWLSLVQELLSFCFIVGLVKFIVYLAEEIKTCIQLSPAPILPTICCLLPGLLSSPQLFLFLRFEGLPKAEQKRDNANTEGHYLIQFRNVSRASWNEEQDRSTPVRRRYEACFSKHSQGRAEWG